MICNAVVKTDNVNVYFARHAIGIRTFSQICWWGGDLAFWGIFRSLSGTESDGGDSRWVQNQIRGDLENIYADVKNAHNRKIGANVCISSIIKLSDAAMS